MELRSSSGGDKMANDKKTNPKKQQEEHELKGTFISVLFVGGFILASWIAVFLLFILR